METKIVEALIEEIEKRLKVPERIQKLDLMGKKYDIKVDYDVKRNIVLGLREANIKESTLLRLLYMIYHYKNWHPRDLDVIYSNVVVSEKPSWKEDDKIDEDLPIYCHNVRESLNECYIVIETSEEGVAYLEIRYREVGEIDP